MNVETDDAARSHADGPQDDADTLTPGDNSPGWSPLHDGTQPIMDRLLAECGGEL
jgi:hypothetical protein